MTQQLFRQIAKRIAAELFTNGRGNVAERLVLMNQRGQDLGGWGRRPVEDVIVRVLTELFSEEHPEAK